jgi:hypothetical protein
VKLITEDEYVSKVSSLLIEERKRQSRMMLVKSVTRSTLDVAIEDSCPQECELIVFPLTRSELFLAGVGPSCSPREGQTARVKAI